MSLNLPKLSVIIPAYNRRFILKDCLDAIFDQTYAADDYEILIVDDGSTDGTKEFINELQKSRQNMFYLSQNNQGPAAARNFGVKYAKAEIIVFIDSDCMVPRDFLEIMRNAFDDHAGISAFGATAVRIFRNGFFSPLTDYLKSAIIHDRRQGQTVLTKDTLVAPWPRLCTDACAIRKDAFLTVGGFDTKFSWAGEDPDLWIRLLKKGHEICSLNELGVWHYERSTVKDLIGKFYKYGAADVVNIKDHFKNRFIVHFAGFIKRKPISIYPFCCTVCLRVTFLKVIIISFFFVLFFPAIPMIFLAMYFLEQYRKTKKINLAFRLMAFNYVTECSFLIGGIISSIKNRVIFI